MDACPNEILGLIFAEACTDDGLTGRSLSLVSRRIRNSSRRYALRSIALYGSHQLSSFLPVLEKAYLEGYTVRHLYLTDRPRTWMECFPDQDEKQLEGREQWPGRELEHGEHSADNFDVKDIEPALPYSASPILRILETVAPTLETLTLLLFDRYDQQPLSDTTSLPRLRELTIHGSSLANALWRDSNPTHAQPALPQCPSLRRLHVIFALGRSWTTVVSHLAPHLTHLRISRIVASPMPLINIVRGLERLPGLKHDPAGAFPGFPPTLERVLVQLLQNRPQNRTCRCAQALLVSPMGSHLKNVAMRDALQRIVLLKPAIASAHTPESLIGDSSDVELYTSLKMAWLQHVAGSESTVWDVKPSSVLASYAYWAGGQ